MRLKKALAILTAALLLSGCGPVISKSTLSTVDRDVKFEDIVNDPEAFKGRRVVFGGTILGTENREDKTVVEVFQEGLDFRLTPSIPEESAGRFLIEFPGFKDPQVYTKGKKITVAGTVKGFETGTLGKRQYRYPVIEPIEAKLLPMRGYDEPRIGIGIGLGYTHID